MTFYPVLENQKRRWAGYLAGDTSFNVAAVYQVEGDVIAPRLARVIRAVFERHVGLKTRLVVDDQAELRQTTVSKSCPVELLEIDTELADRHRWEERVDALIDPPFDLLAGPLARGFVLRLRDGVVFGFAIDHACADGYSAAILLREVAAAYRGELLPAVTGTPFDCAETQRRYLASAEAEASRAYWAGVFQDEPLAAALAGPVAPFDGGDRDNAALVTVTLPGDVLEAACRRWGCTPYLLTVSAVMIALSEFGGLADVTVLSPFVGRTSPEAIDVVAWLANVVPLRARIGVGRPLDDVLEGIRDSVYAALNEAELPFGLIQQLPNLDLPRWHPWAFVDCHSDEVLLLDGAEATEVENIATTARPGLWAVSTVGRDGFHLRLRAPGSAEVADRLTRLGELARAVLLAAASDGGGPTENRKRLVGVASHSPLEG